MSFVRMRKLVSEELRASKNYIIAAILLFLGACLFGFVFSSSLGFIDDIIRNALSKVRDLSGISLIGAIFLNNAQSAFVSMFFGIVFGIFPIFNALFNGMVVGYVLSRVVSETGLSELWRILPHGIFELPAIFIALGLGLRLGTSFFTKSWKKELGKRVYQACLVFLFIVLPLLIIAAIIEGLLITFYK
jgi:stage II sporulation protein M